MKRPFVFLSLFLTAGILTAYHIKIDIYLVIFLAISYLIIHLLLNRINISFDLGLAYLVFGLGLFIMYINLDKAGAIDLDRDFRLEGLIVSVNKLEEDYGSYIFKLEGGPGLKKFGREKILLTTDKTDLEIGDRLIFNGQLKEARENKNPLLFNYKNYLKGKSINYTSYIDGEVIERKKSDAGGLLKLKRNFEKRLVSSLANLSERNRSFLLSIMTGRTGFMDQDDLENFRNLGLAHILAISGLHLGLISSFLLIILSILGLDRRYSNILVIVFIFFYAYLIDFPASVLRAGLMLSLSLLAMNLKRYSDQINNLFFVSFILALINPYLIFSLSFQLSFIATLSILLIVKRLETRFFKSDKNFIKSLVVIFGVQLGLFPIQAYYFNSINLLSILANLFILPLVGIILILGLVLFIMGGFFPTLGYSLSLILNRILDLVFFIGDGLGDFSFLSFRLASPTILAIVFYYLILIVILGYISLDRLPREIGSFIFIGLLLIIGLNSLNYYGDRSLLVEFIDVDQGDSSILSYRGRNYLFDTGGNAFKSFDIGKNIVIPYLKKTGRWRLDGVFISHFDADHCKSLVDIMDELELKSLYLPYKREDNEYYREIVKKAKEKSIPIYIVKRGDRLRLDENLDFKVLWPNKAYDDSQSDNNLSMVLEVNYRDQTLLLTGDIEREAELALVEGGLPKIDILKSPHHGSKTSSSQEFLEATRPDQVIIQLGEDNSFSHPSPEVLERYERGNMKIYRTDRDGLISLRMDRNNYKIDRFIGEKYSIIDIIVDYRYRIMAYIVYIILLVFLIGLYKGNKEWDSFELQ